MNMDLLKIAVDAPLMEAFTYLPMESTPVERGQSVLVPLGKRQVAGVVLGPGENSGDFQLKSVIALDGERPRLPEAYLRWLEWISQYYIYPLGEVIHSLFPPLSKDGKSRKQAHSPLTPQVLEAQKPLELNSEQRQCFEKIRAQPNFGVHLLHGVTGSGKTEVYLHLLAKILEAGGQGLVLVPEISLTPQLIERFSQRFPDQIAVLHSHLTDRERTNQWWEAVEGKKRILIGARSALFCPMKDLRLIVIDEEHEPSFKQDEKFRYHARDASISLARELNIPVLLGSATPSLESWRNARDGKFHLHEMKSRVAERSMPEVLTVDLRDRKSTEISADSPFWLSPQLQEALADNLQKGEQSALFLNRRGVAQTVLCESCGFSHECPNCSITLTLHGQSHLVCHYCDYSERLKDHCPECKEGIVKPIGLGTELVETDLRRLFPEARILRADRDEIQSREAMEDFVRKMAAHEIDILVGTQMIAKGLDFPNLTLVGLVLADVGFHLPDFRASERSFQLLTQMGGRSGRHSANPGKVIIQTFNPEHPSVQFAGNADFEGFANFEMNLRESLKYPPYGRVGMLRIQAAQLDKANGAARTARARAERLKATRTEYAEISILGPCAAPLAKLRNQYRFQLLFKADKPRVLSAFCRQLLGDHRWFPTGTKVQVDIDPMNMM